MEYDRGDSFPFDFDPNGFPFGSKSKRDVSKHRREMDVSSLFRNIERKCFETSQRDVSSRMFLMRMASKSFFQINASFICVCLLEESLLFLFFPALVMEEDWKRLDLSRLEKSMSLRVSSLCVQSTFPCQQLPGRVR